MKVKEKIPILLSMIAMALLLFLLSIYVFQIQLYYLDSETMEPTITEGSLLLSKKESINELKKGDVITYKAGNSDLFVTSRIVEVDEELNQVLCKADSYKLKEGSFISYTQYQGTMFYSVPYIGKIIAFMKTTTGKIINFIVLLLLLIKIGLNMLEEKKKRLSLG